MYLTENYKGKAKKNKPKYNVDFVDRTDLIMKMRQLFREKNIPTASKKDRELCGFLYSTLQDYLPELSEPVVGNTADFLEKVRPWLSQKNVNEKGDPVDALGELLKGHPIPFAGGGGT